jgi:hypothetical protein
VQEAQPTFFCKDGAPQTQHLGASLVMALAPFEATKADTPSPRAPEPLPVSTISSWNAPRHSTRLSVKPEDFLDPGIRPAEGPPQRCHEARVVRTGLA